VLKNIKNYGYQLDEKIISHLAAEAAVEGILLSFTIWFLKCNLPPSISARGLQ
jgi:hypothetical protein